ncbi:MAG TPA: succinate dehydrogenase, cytochrome b556 subunit [Usitatibacter sp.]|nr:succinate dehydrogenase, cytochrome b556 subunit [Usitatibacter sp.]
MSAAPRARPKYYEFNLANHWPPAVLSIVHRITGALLFFPLLPLALWILQSTLGSEQGYGRWHALLAHPLAKLVAIGAAWAYAHHFFAGLRYLVLDMHLGMGKGPARASALAVFAAEALAVALVAWRLW